MNYIYIPIFYFFSSFVSTFLIISVNLSSNLLWLHSQNFHISFQMFFELLFKDLSNGLLFLLIVLVTFLIAFFTTPLIRYFLPIKRTLSYSIAGLLSIFVMLKLTTYVFTGAVLIAGMRSLLGFCLFCLSGMFGGFIFGFLLNKVLKSYG